MSNKLGSPLRTFLIAAALLLSLPGCDMIQQQLGIEDLNAKAARADAEGKAVGGACRPVSYTHLDVYKRQ